MARQIVWAQSANVVGIPFGAAAFRPTFTAPGVPNVDFIAGRTSTNPLSVAIIASAAPLTGASSTSNTVANSGTLTFSMNFGSYTVGDNITLASAATPTAFFGGPISNVSGSNITINRSGTGNSSGDGNSGVSGGAGTNASDWMITRHLPTKSSDSGNAIRIGSNSTNISITDWDFRNLDACLFLQNTKTITFTQCEFDIAGWVTATNVPYLGARSGTPTYNVSYSNFNGYSQTTNVTTCLGAGLILAEYIAIYAWPADLLDIFNGTSSQNTIIRYSYCETSGTDPLLHPDGMQLTSWTSGNGLFLHHLVMNTITGTSNFNIGTNSGDITVPITIDNVILEGGPAYNIYSENKQKIVATSTISYGINVYVNSGQFGPIYPALNTGCVNTGLRFTGLKSAVDGSTVTATFNILVSQSSVTIGTGPQTFTAIAGFPASFTPTAPITIFNPPASGGIVNSMTGTVTSWDGTTLVVNVTSTAGSGTFSYWSVSFTGTSYP